MQLAAEFNKIFYIKFLKYYKGVKNKISINPESAQTLV